MRLLSIHGHWLRPADRRILRVLRPFLTAIVIGFGLLAFLLENQGRVYSRAELLRGAWPKNVTP